MAKTIINIKADKEIKENARKLAQELGLSLSDVVNASLRNFIRTREISFSHIPSMTPEFERLLGVIEGDIKVKKEMSPVFETKEEMERYLDAL